MFVQTIFFIALAAFIYLLARRYASNNAGFAQSFGGFNRALGSVGRSVVVLISRLRLPKLSLRKSVSVQPGSKTNASLDADHDFWKEGTAAKPELSSHFEEGEELFRAGKHKEAEQFFLKAAANSPSDAKVYARLGLLYLEQRNFSDAIESLKMAVKLEKYNPSRHYNLALAYWGKKDTRRAIASVREAISLDPVTPKYRKLLEQLLNG